MTRSTALDVGRDWDGSIVLREGQEATVRVTAGILELRFVDRTRELWPPRALGRPPSLDLKVRPVDAPSEGVPPVSDPRWIKVIVGLTPFQPTMLACQILFTHVRRSVREDPSASTIDHWIGELRAYFVKYESVSTRDLAQILG